MTINLNLKDDGTYTYNSEAPCMEGTDASGKYSIYKNIIYLYNDKCNMVNLNNECTYQNCKPIIELKYENNQISAPVRENWIKLNKTV